MKRSLVTVLALVLCVLGGWLRATAQNTVVVELFTSEGCSSCPPADAVLAQLSEAPASDGSPLILLGEHVDYWNYIGWTDRFSAKQFTDRQAAYAKALHGSVYTPQMIIDGRDPFVGNDLAEVRNRIAAASSKPKPARVMLAWQSQNRLHIAIHSLQPADGEVLLAITEDGLTTSVAKGENGGKTLHHAAVVRQLRSIGNLDGGNFDGVVEVPLQADWNPRNLKAAVLVQQPQSRKVLGAGVIEFR